MKLGYWLYIHVGYCFEQYNTCISQYMYQYNTCTEQHMYVSSKIRVINKVLRKGKLVVNMRDIINTLVSWVHSLMQ